MTEIITKRMVLIKENCKGKILHLGGTNESLHQYLLNNGFEVYNVDIRGKPDFTQDLSKDIWTEISGNYDTIVAGEIIEHIGNPIGFIRNCKSMLKDNGILIITTPNATSLQYLYNPAWCVYHESLYIHIHAFTPPMLINILQKNGMQVKHSFYLNEFLYNKLGRIIAWLIPRLRGDIFITAVKT